MGEESRARATLKIRVIEVACSAIKDIIERATDRTQDAPSESFLPALDRPIARRDNVSRSRWGQVSSTHRGFDPRAPDVGYAGDETRGIPLRCVARECTAGSRPGDATRELSH